MSNALKPRLKAGARVFGCLTRHPSASLVEVLSLQGWDFVVIDAEHGPIDPLACEGMTRAAELGGATPIVRVPANDRATILRYLDVGPQGLHAPMIECCADVENVLRFAKYKPDGERGLASVRAASYGHCDMGEYVRQANSDILIVAQIESQLAIQQLDEIVSVPGIDVVFIGPTDLALSLGVVGNNEHPLVLDALETIARVVTDSSKALGIHVNSEGDARAWIERGAQYLCFNIETLVRHKSNSLLNNLREVKS